MDHHFQSAGSAVLVQARFWWLLQVHLRGCCSACLSFRFSSAKLLSGCLVSRPFSCMGLFLHRHRTLHFPLNCLGLLSAHTSTSLRYFWVSSQLSSLNGFQFSVMCKAAETALCAISQVSDEDIKHHWPSELTTDVWPLAGLVVMPLTESFEPGRSVFSPPFGPRLYSVPHESTWGWAVRGLLKALLQMGWTHQLLSHLVLSTALFSTCDFPAINLCKLLSSCPWKWFSRAVYYVTFQEIKASFTILWCPRSSSLLLKMTDICFASVISNIPW